MKCSVAEIHPINSDQTSASRTIAELAYRRIRQDILWGRFAPGSPLRSDELRARYGIGVSPLREALTRLCVRAAGDLGRPARFPGCAAHRL